MATVSITKEQYSTFQPIRRRVAYFGMTRQKNCVNCGRMILEETDLYSRRFCSTRCKEEYCCPVRSVIKQI